MGYELAARPVKCPTQPPRLRSGQRSCPDRVSSEGHQKARSARESGSALQPAKEAIASHRRFSLLQKGTRHVSASSRHIASVNREWIVERMHWPRIDSRHGKPAIEVANQYWRGKNDEPESKPEARPTAAGWPTGRPGEARSAAARWPEARPAAARRTARRTAEPAEPLIR